MRIFNTILVGIGIFFASFLIVTCISVIFSKNPVNSVLFLVLAFLNSTFLFILIGAEFVGIILAIVYIGAVAILFLLPQIQNSLDFDDFLNLRILFLNFLVIVSNRN